MKALKIHRCSDSHMWYRNHIGTIVPLVRVTRNEFISREPAGYTNIVEKQDADVVDVHWSEILYLSPHERRD